MRRIFNLCLAFVFIAFVSISFADMMDSNTTLNSYRIAENLDLSVTQMVNGVVDAFVDESGVDTGASSYLTIMDSSDSGHEASFWGHAARTIVDKKWGDASIYFDGTDDHISFPDSDDWDILENGTDDWTIDFWVNLASNPATAGWGTMVCQWEDDTHFWMITHYNGDLRFFSYLLTMYNDTGFINTDLVQGTWYHISLIKVDRDIGVFVNGIQKGYADQDYYTDFDNSLFIGARGGSAVYPEELNGYIDELRIQKSNIFEVTIDTSSPCDSSFTPPTGPHSGDVAGTELLLHMEFPTDGTSNYFAPAYGDDLTLVSETITASSEPSKAKIVILEEDIDEGITLNTEIIAKVSKSGTWDTVILSEEGEYEDGKRVLTGEVTSLSGTGGTDVDMQYKIETDGVDLRIHGVSLSWE